MKKLILMILCVLLLASTAIFPYALAETETARPSVNGRLHVEGTALVDSTGKAVQLRGVSTHGLTWYPAYVSASLFKQISEDWSCNFVRLAMYSELYCGGERDANLSLMRKGIDAAIAADQYVLVDWHILNDDDPNQHTEEAKEFFAMIASEYADKPNLIFEICNEPNGETSWADVKKYAEEVIPVIRQHIPEAVVVVGTPDYDRNLGDSFMLPLAFDNVMYVLHFYAASHQDALFRELTTAVEKGLPVFISECGICEKTGDGRIDFASAARWFSYLNEHKIGYAVWSLSDKSESSAIFNRGFNPESRIREEDLTTSGRWVRELLRGADPETIPVPAPQVDKDLWQEIRNGVANSLGEGGGHEVSDWLIFAGVSTGLLAAAVVLVRSFRKKEGSVRRTYGDIVGNGRNGKKQMLGRIVLICALWFTCIYILWRLIRSIPFAYGPLAVIANLVLLAVEIGGFIEFVILLQNLLGRKDYPLPEIPADAWPEVDIFIATYNEPTELLRRTVNGCIHMKYPDPGKVHIWICDDNRRSEMRALAEEMGVGYFDRPDNQGAKAGNLNHALGLTSAPYIVTFDADMIPRSNFLLKTIPYFVDAEIREQARPEEERLHLGLLQTPQSFYDPDVFQHALYCEKRVPNEQDFFYRTIEPAKTSTNSVIYGGSNTVLSREAVEKVGGFYTESITEDFATGLLIESAGYVSLALDEPLASGQTPHTFREYIKQRTRWGRGVIVTARKLNIFRRKNLTPAQKISYMSSVTYWYSPIKNLIYMLSPLLYAVFALPVFRCNWLEVLMFWLPMFVLQDICLRTVSRNATSVKWSGIYETSVMPHLLIPILKESVGITMSTFKVTDKSGRGGRRRRDIRSMLPFLFLIALSVAGIVRLISIYEPIQTVGILIILFWIIRNLYYLVMSVFLVNGRDSDGETVLVNDTEPVKTHSDGKTWEGVTTRMTEHSVTLFLDESEDLGLGAQVDLEVLSGEKPLRLKGVVTGIRESRNGHSRIHTVEILNDCGNRTEYWQLLYDRVPTLPQSLHGDFGALFDLWQNIAHRVARSRR